MAATVFDRSNLERAGTPLYRAFTALVKSYCLRLHRLDAPAIPDLFDLNAVIDGCHPPFLNLLVPRLISPKLRLIWKPPKQPVPRPRIWSFKPPRLRLIDLAEVPSHDPVMKQVVKTGLDPSFEFTHACPILSDRIPKPRLKVLSVHRVDYMPW